MCVHARTNTHTHPVEAKCWRACSWPPPSVFLRLSRFLPPRALSRQSCGFWGFGSSGLRLSCSGQNPHAKLSCQGGNEACPASHAAGRCQEEEWMRASHGPDTASLGEGKLVGHRVVGLQRPRPSVFKASLTDEETSLYSPPSTPPLGRQFLPLL